MTKEEACAIIETEATCVKRAEADACNRDCAKCDLVLSSHDILTAYKMVIDMLKAEVQSRG